MLVIKNILFIAFLLVFSYKAWGLGMCPGEYDMVKKQDLDPNADEYVCKNSNGVLHKDYYWKTLRGELIELKEPVGIEVRSYINPINGEVGYRGETTNGRGVVLEKPAKKAKYTYSKDGDLINLKVGGDITCRYSASNTGSLWSGNQEFCRELMEDIGALGMGQSEKSAKGEKGEACKELVENFHGCSRSFNQKNIVCPNGLVYIMDEKSMDNSVIRKLKEWVGGDSSDTSDAPSKIMGQ